MQHSAPDSKSDPSALLDRQTEFFRSGQTKEIAFRIERLKKLGSELERRSDDLLAALDADLGKPPVEAYTSEIYFVLSEIRLFVRKLKRWARPRRVRSPFYHWPARSEIRLEPRGKALIVAPWNYPAQLSLGPLIAAVAAGNVVLLKPSELAPATAKFLAELISSVFNPGHVAVIEGGPEIGEALMEHPFDHWFFTGSERVGRLYATAAARHLAPITLELGGKCPCVVSDDVSLERTVERLLVAKFSNAGQTWIAPDFVLIDESILQEFVDRMSSALSSCYADSTDDLARIASDHHYERLQKLIPDDAVRIGADRREGLHLAPTIIPDASWNSPAMQEEIFGPILPVIGYADLDDALRHLSRLPAPLALSKDRSTLEKVAAALPSGSVCFNDALKQATNLNLPFGGVGPSGMGRYRGRSGFETFSYQRAVTRRSFARDPFLIKPPYEGKLERLRKFLG
ncbi:MAG: aldehyde dehydrogenase (NAD+) [Verrucomicrobiales bacterium]|jgi:aldehyde dehydrogenase (NAD+)